MMHMSNQIWQVGVNDAAQINVLQIIAQPWPQTWYLETKHLLEDKDGSSHWKYLYTPTTSGIPSSFKYAFNWCNTTSKQPTTNETIFLDIQGIFLVSIAGNAVYVVMALISRAMKKRMSQEKQKNAIELQAQSVYHFQLK